MDPNKIIAALSPIATVVAAAFTLYFWVESRYVHSVPEFKNLEQRFEIKVKSDHIKELNSIIWLLEDKLVENPRELTAKEELRKRKEDKTNAEAELATLRQRGQ